MNETPQQIPDLQPTTPQEPTIPPTQPQPTEPVPPGLPPAEPTNRNWIVVLILSLVVLAVVGGSLFYAYSQNFWPFEREAEEPLTIEKGWNYYPNFKDTRDLYIEGDTVWVAAASGLHKYSQSQKKIIKSYTLVDGIPGFVTALMKIGNKLYLGTQSGVVIFDINSETFTYLRDEVTESYNHNIDHFEYDRRTLWMTTFGGFRSLDISTGNWETYGHRDSNFALAGNSIYLIDRAFPTANIWKADKSNVEWGVDFTLPSLTWRNIDANDKYVIVSADLKEGTRSVGSAMYYKDLGTGRWEKINILDEEIPNYNKLTLDGDVALFVFQDEDRQNYLGAYNIAAKSFRKHSLDGLEGPSFGGGYVYPNGNRIWFTTFSSDPLSYVDLDTGELGIGVDLKTPATINMVVGEHNGSLLVNTDEGVGLFDRSTKKFEQLSEFVAAKIVETKDNIWFHLGVSGLGGPGPTISKYDKEEKIFESRSLNQFTLVDHYNAPENKVYMINFELVERKSLAKLVLYDYTTDSKEMLFDLSSQGIETFDLRSAPFYFERYGILIFTEKEIYRYVLETGEFSLVISLEFGIKNAKTDGNNLYLLSTDNDVYVVDDNDSVRKIYNQQEQKPQPQLFEVLHDGKILISSLKILNKYEIGADIGFGPGGFSFRKNELLIINTQGIVEEVITPRMLLDPGVIDTFVENNCVWLTGRNGPASYCR